MPQPSSVYQIVIDWVTLWTAELYYNQWFPLGIKLEWFFAERVAEIDCHEIPPLLFSMASALSTEKEIVSKCYINWFMCYTNVKDCIV